MNDENEAVVQPEPAWTPAQLVESARGLLGPAGQRLEREAVRGALHLVGLHDADSVTQSQLEDALRRYFETPV